MNKLLELFANQYPELVVIHEKTGVIRLRKNNVHLFEYFIKEYADKVYKNEKENYITLNEILRHYRLSKRVTRVFLEQKIREFSEQNPHTVKKVSRKIGKEHIKTVRYFAVNKSYLLDFFKFAGLTVNKEKVPDKQKQPKLDPSTPGYRNDPTLRRVLDKDMDAIAWRLAAKKISDKDEADAALLLELQKIAKGRGKE